LDPRHQKPPKNPHNLIRGIAFDLDDTLFPRKPAMEDFLKSLGANDLGPILARDQNGYSHRPSFFAWLARHLNLPLDGPACQQKFITDFPSHISIQFAHHTILKTLQSRGCLLALLSNGGSHLQRAKLAATGLAKFFPLSRTLFSGDLPDDKPSPSVFHELAHRMNLPASQILFVGDHLENDVLGSHHAGLAAAWIRHGRKSPTNLPENTLVIDDLAELLPHFRGYERC